MRTTAVIIVSCAATLALHVLLLIYQPQVSSLATTSQTSNSILLLQEQPSYHTPSSAFLPPHTRQRKFNKTAYTRSPIWTMITTSRDTQPTHKLPVQDLPPAAIMPPANKLRTTVKPKRHLLGGVVKGILPKIGRAWQWLKRAVARMVEMTLI